MHADPLSAYAYRWFGPVSSRARIDNGFEFFWRHLRRLDDQFDMVVSASHSLSSRLTAGGLRKVETIPMGVTSGVFSPGLRNPALRARMLERCGLGPDATLLVGLALFGDGRDRARVIRAAANSPHVMLGAPVTDRQELATLLASADALAAAIGRFIDEGPAAQRARATEAAPRVMAMDEHFRRLFGIYRQAIASLSAVA